MLEGEGRVEGEEKKRDGGGRKKEGWRGERERGMEGGERERDGGGRKREGWRGEKGGGMGRDGGGMEWCGVKKGGGAELTHLSSSLPVSSSSPMSSSSTVSSSSPASVHERWPSFVEGATLRCHFDS